MTLQPWIANETRTADFGDERLAARYRLLLDRRSAKPSLSIPAAWGGPAETAAAYRFFANDHTDPDAVPRPPRRAALERIRRETVVIAAQDTTEVDWTRKQETIGGLSATPSVAACGSTPWW